MIEPDTKEAWAAWIKALEKLVKVMEELAIELRRRSDDLDREGRRNS